MSWVIIVVCGLALIATPIGLYFVVRDMKQHPDIEDELPEIHRPPNSLPPGDVYHRTPDFPTPDFPMPTLVLRDWRFDIEMHDEEVTDE